MLRKSEVLTNRVEEKKVSDKLSARLGSWLTGRPVRRLLLATGLLLAVGCGRIDNAIDCNTICNRYRTCNDAKYDVDRCAERCRADSRSDSDYQRKADRCAACIDDRSCASATFNCGVECAGIVP